MKKSIIPLFILMLTACGKTSAPQEQKAMTADSTKTDSVAANNDADEDSTDVDATTSATAIPNHTSFNGTLDVSPQRHATVSVTMGGKVRSTILMPGAYVRRGQTVVTLVNPSFIDLQKEYLDSYTQSQFLETEYARQEKLHSQEASSQKHYQQSKADYTSMKIRMQAAAMQLKQLGISPASLLRTGIHPYLNVVSPISGYVSHLSINIGKYLHEGDPICEIFDKSAPMLCLTAHEKDVHDVHIGNRVQFRVNGMGKQTFSAVVTSISQEVDEVNRSIEVYCRVKVNNPLFRPGMYVNARVEKR
jgi:cobalt-zinc-cadmium efflux system membrane fusion protein